MPQLAAWEKVYIEPDALTSFESGPHGEIGCGECHKGNTELRGENNAENMNYAHQGMLIDPASQENVKGTCGFCHRPITDNQKTSMHSNLWGEKTALATRTGALSYDALPPSTHQNYDKDCGKCHTTCGQCHISRPNAVGGGFLDNHTFQKRPSLELNCTACHGSRIGEEYRGEREAQRDVHYIPGAMHCVDCHDEQEMHGNGIQYADRLSNPLVPGCEKCHADVKTANAWHNQHWGELSCTVCHSQEYKNCNNCHAGAGGVAEPSYIEFKIGKNPVPALRSYKFVTVRHIPVAENTFKAWGQNLPDYTELPTWKYTVPHNIQRWTARTDTSGGVGCSDNCHINGTKNREYYLLEDSLEANFPEDRYPGEIEANQPVVVDDALPDNWIN